jgi:zinc/manganese transport system substrate-binding protein
MIDQMARKSRMRRMFHILAVIALAVGGAAMGGPAGAAEPITVVAAENFYGDLASQIGGTHVKVTSILANPDDDPHLFESSPSTARTLADAAIVVYNGADYDPWMDRLLSASTAPSRAVLVAADLTGHRSGDNPHLWYDPRTFPAVAGVLADELSRRDPADAAEFKANLEAFDAAFGKVLDGVAAIKAAYGGTAVTATEPVFGYMAAAMGLEMLNEDFQFATMNETEPSASDVAAFEASLRDGTAKILFYNSQVTDETTARLLDLAKASGVAVIGVTETEPAGETIESWFAGQIAAVQAALAARH